MPARDADGGEEGRGPCAFRQALVEDNLGLVRHVVRRAAPPGVDAEDLFQCGCIGLIRAADSYDPARGVRFSTYAVPFILGEVRRHLRHRWTVVLGRGGQELLRRVRRQAEVLRQQEGRDPTVGELAAALGIEPAEVAAVLEAARVPEPLEAEPSGGVSVITAVDPDGRPENVVEAVALRRALASLRPVERAVIILRFYADCTQQEVAARLGISQAHVSRLQRRALSALYGALAVQGRRPQGQPPPHRAGRAPAD
ncbi:MAG: sigma-70 family RNA polymerase sigma factor [Clostridia bacterium]|nr:sigma-70 family RNA polymerase sigma factor [Clostridia bacterium]